MERLEDYLRLNAARTPDKMAVVGEKASVTYAQLWRRVQSRAEELRSRGCRPGQAVLTRASQTVDFLVDYFATHLIGSVAVPLESQIPEERFRAFEAFLKASTIPLGTADILFTTGTTGESKGVMISHETLIANAENLVEAQGYSSGLTFILAGPLNHIGTLSKVYPVILTGGTLLLLEGMKDLNRFFAALDGPSAPFATFLVPASLRLLMAWSGEKLRAYSSLIEFIETGAAPLAQADMDRLCELLPHTRLYNTYASTETGIVCTHDFNSDKRVAGCLGRPMRHSRVFITPEGTVACQGKTLMLGYVGEPGKTASILRDGTLFTHDNGWLDSEGMLRLTGRADDVINVGGFKVAPSEVEDVALSLPEVADCVCVPAHHPIMGSVLKLFVVLADGASLDRKRLARHIHSSLEPYKVPTLYEPVDHVQRTYNGKIDRKYYRSGL